MRSIFFLSLLALFACQANDHHPTTAKIGMAARLASIRDTARNTEFYPYFIGHSLEKLEQKVANLPFGLASDDRLNYASLLLLKGETLQCINQLEGYLKATGGIQQITGANLKFYKLLAYAHLRHGEQTNCILNHSSESCILPLQGGGIHTDLSGATAAVHYYSQLLAYNHHDYQSRWFLNIAYMAIGSYPAEVPQQLLIPESAFHSETDFPRFPNIAMSLGVDVNNHAGGSCMEDFNNDGFLDIFTTAYSLEDQSKLYLNDGAGHFLDFTEASGIKGLTGGLNCTHADINNDGWIDIFITRGAWLREHGKIPNSLLLNQGDGTFVDGTQAAGLLSFHPSNTSAFADFDLDGYLDLFVGNESGPKLHGCELFHNNGNGTFTNVAPDLQLEINQFVKGVAWGDINNDRLPDLYVSVFGGKNLLFVNRGGTSIADWSFEEISQKAGVQEPIHSFPCWFWDANNDGFQDLMVFGYINLPPDDVPSEILKNYLGEDFLGELPRLYLNNGDETFVDVAERMNLNTLLYSMGANFGDLDNDGYPDFYTGNGEFNMLATVPDRMFRNAEGQYFQDVTTAGGFGQIQKGHGISFGDIDNDGDQDIYHQVGGAAEGDVFHNMLFQNPGFANHWITLQLEGTTANRSAIGATIKVVVQSKSGASRSIYHQVGTGGSFGANSLQAEIGLGQANQIDSLCIYWPDQEKTVQYFEQTTMDQFYRLTQGDSLELVKKNPIIFNLSAHHH